MSKIGKFVVALVLVALAACSPKASVIKAQEQGKNSPVGVTETPLALSTSTVLPTFTPQATNTPTPTPQDIGIKFKGYWLKITKNSGSGSWGMDLIYQDGAILQTVASFCVHGSDDNTPDGVYFVVTDRGTTYPHAPGYATTYFSHNYAFKVAKESWYLHPAPWNDKGVGGCPLKSSGGCVNMRPQDFDVIVNGGTYTNPLTDQVSEIPHLGIGTPIVVIDPSAHGSSCDFLGQCMKVLECDSGLMCFKQFSCQYCVDSVTRWKDILDIKPELRILDTVN